MAKRSSVQIDWFGDDLKKAIDDSGEPALWAAGQALKREAVGIAPYKTGALKRSAFVKTADRTDYVKGRRDKRKLPTPNDKSVIVGFAAWYGNLLEDSGAKAHRIPRKNRKILKIQGKHYSSVNHPGMKRDPFLAKAMESMKTTLAQEIISKIGDGVESRMDNA